MSNVRSVALGTGIREIHTSLSTQERSAAYDGGAEVNALHGGFTRFLVRENEVRALKSALHAISPGD